MQRRRRYKQQTFLQDRIVEWAESVRKLANGMRPGPKRDELRRKLRRAETAMAWKIGPIPDCSRRSWIANSNGALACGYLHMSNGFLRRNEYSRS